MSEPFPLALHVTASAAVVRGCCGTPDDAPCPNLDTCPRSISEES